MLAWGATNARQPTQVVEQTEFRVDYSGGWGTFGRAVWKGFRNTCGALSRPRAPLPRHRVHRARRIALGGAALAPLTRRTSACRRGRRATGPGSSGSRTGAARSRSSRSWLDWSYGGRWHHLFGRLTYRGLPVHGFSTTPTGDPLDRYGRVLYLDTLDSAYGRRLAPRERLRRAQAGRNLLLRLRPAHEPHGRAAAGGERRALPARGLRAGRDAGRPLGGRGSSELRRRQPEARRARGEHERPPAVAHERFDAVSRVATNAGASGRRRVAGGARRRGCRSASSRATRARGAPG